MKFPIFFSCELLVKITFFSCNQWTKIMIFFPQLINKFCDFFLQPTNWWILQFFPPQDRLTDFKIFFLWPINKFRSFFFPATDWRISVFSPNNHQNSWFLTVTYTGEIQEGFLQVADDGWNSWFFSMTDFTIFHATHKLILRFFSHEWLTDFM